MTTEQPTAPVNSANPAPAGRETPIRLQQWRVNVLAELIRGAAMAGEIDLHGKTPEELAASADWYPRSQVLVID